MSQFTDPDTLFSSFNVYNQIRPMMGTYHVIDLQLENTSAILEGTRISSIRHFHDAEWMKIMGKSLIYSCSRDPGALFGMAGSYHFSLVYSLPVTKLEGTDLLAGVTSSISSFISGHTGSPVKLSGKVLEFPDPKIMSAFFLWKQNQNRDITVQSMILEILMNNGKTFEEARETLITLGDTKSKLSVISEQYDGSIPEWIINGLCAYWKMKGDSVVMSLNQNIPSGPDFLSFMMEIFDQKSGNEK
ncbi:MAG: hypothetical protein JXR95_10600 [Deltaproteobacteria bacterium]|nr:hypothetical protein [Deltaproteobacteria bacterium]